MEADPLELPAKDLAHVLIACDPGEPLKPNDSRYMDLRTLRGGEGIEPLKKHLAAPLRPGKYHHRCLCGHRGSGKSTELLSLKKWADEAGFLTSHVEVDTQFGLSELEFSDLYLLAATMVEQAMEAAGKPLPQEKIQRVVQWFAEVIEEDQGETKSEIAAEAEAQLGGKLPFGLGKLVAKLTAGIKATSSHAIKTRQKLRNYPDQLIDLTNDLLRTATEQLKDDRSRGLLLLFDNLDRYEPEQIDRVLFKSVDLIKKLGCHCVFTMPIALEYEPLSGAIQDCFGFSVVLPMLALRRKSDLWKADVVESDYDADAIAIVRDALALRIDLDLFRDPADIDLLIKMSGGCIRDLMHLATLAYSYVDGSSQFTHDAIVEAIRTMRDTYLRRLTDEDYRRLAAIARRESVPRDALTIRLLFHRYALEYRNDSETWQDVHPLIIAMEKFRRVYDDKSPIVATGR